METGVEPRLQLWIEIAALHNGATRICKNGQYVVN